MKVKKLKKRIQLMGHLHSADDLIQHLIKMGFPPQNIVYTGVGIFFTLYCESKEEKDLEKFVSYF
jgi:hypothetical protein